MTRRGERWHDACERFDGARCSLYPFYPTEEPSGGNVHHEAVQGKGKEAKKAGRGHLENFPALKHREGIKPFCGGPIIPEFPEPAADPACEKESIKAPAYAFGQIAEKRGQAEA